MLLKSKKWLLANVATLVYLQVWVGVLGSLYFSEILDLPPCVLCLWQRGLLYPLILIMSIGLWRRDRALAHYVLPFSILGILVAAYHNLLYYNLIPESLAPCSVQLPCTVENFTLAGFITIPLMSLGAFILITVGMFVFVRTNRQTSI